MKELWSAVVSLVAPPRCAACGQSFDGGDAFCQDCAIFVQSAPDSGAVFEYGGPVADAIRRYKYGGRSELARPLGYCLAGAADPFVGSVDIVVPVPLHWKRRRSRGYDQAALLVRPVARKVKSRSGFRVLRRVRATPRQSGLGRRARLRNVAGAFAAKPLPGSPRILLLDDVVTTGATLRAARQALAEAGAGEVHSLALAVRVLG
ncbi:MAG: ComF family protein [Myxococcota bacterium]